MGKEVVNLAALRQARNFQQDRAFQDASHPRHDEVVAAVNRWAHAAYDETPAIKGKDPDHSLEEWQQESVRDAKKIMAAPAYQEETHPNHLEAVRTVRKLLVSAYGEDSEIDAELTRPLTAKERMYSEE
jgi:hypothetical protein